MKTLMILLNNLMFQILNMKFLLLFLPLTYNVTIVKAQTFFDTAKDDGIISFSEKNTAQIKLNVTSTATAFGYNYVGGTAAKKTRLIANTTIKAKPNDNGTATLLKTGSLQPGLMINGALGIRLNDLLSNIFFTALDISIKPTYQLVGLTIYDSLRGVNKIEPVYKANKGSFAFNGLINGVVSPGKFNIFFGIQYGPNWTNNADDLTKGTIQTVLSYAGSATQTLFTNAQEVKYGQLINQTKFPLKVDIILDLGIQLNKASGTDINLGFFGYYRNDGLEKKYRKGVGICFLNARDPSKIFSALGYEFPTIGPDVKASDRQQDKGSVIFTVGYSIL